MGALKVTSKRFRFNQINEVLRNDNNHSISLLRRLFCQTFNFPSLDTEMRFHEFCLLSHPHPLSINSFSTNHCSLRLSIKFSLCIRIWWYCNVWYNLIKDTLLCQTDLTRQTGENNQIKRWDWWVDDADYETDMLSWGTRIQYIIPSDLILQKKISQ